MEIEVELGKPEVAGEKVESVGSEGYSEEKLESALQCLQAAEKVRKDEKLMAALKPYIESKKQDLDKVSGIDLLKQKVEKRVKQLDYEETALKRKRGED